MTDATFVVQSYPPPRFGGRETLEIPELVEGLDDFLGVGEDGDEVGLEAGTGSLAKFSSWPSKRRAG